MEMPPPLVSLSQKYTIFTGKDFFSTSLIVISLVAIHALCLSACAPLRRAQLHHSVAHPSTCPSLQFLSCSLLPSSPTFFFLLPLSFSHFWGVCVPQCDKDEDAASVPNAFVSLRLAKCLRFVLGKKSGEPGRRLPIASPWQQAFQTHTRRQAGRGGREHHGPSAQTPNIYLWGSLLSSLHPEEANPKTASKMIVAGQRNACLFVPAKVTYPKPKTDKIHPGH